MVGKTALGHFYNTRITQLGNALAEHVQRADVPDPIRLPAAASGGVSAGVELGIRIAIADMAAASRLLVVIEDEALGNDPDAIAMARGVAAAWVQHLQASTPKGPVQ